MAPSRSLLLPPRLSLVAGERLRPTPEPRPPTPVQAAIQQLCAMLSILSQRGKGASYSIRRRSSFDTHLAARNDARGQAAEDERLALLNESLDTLNELFPNVDPDELRRHLVDSSDESRLYVATELVLKASQTRAGRRGPKPTPLEPWEKFRSENYRKAAKRLLCKEFRGLSKSTVQGVMAEHNYDFMRSRATLEEIAAKSWRFSLSNFFRRSPKPAPPDPNATSTGCEELDGELLGLTATTREEQIAADRGLAMQLNTEEHAAASELVECGCCYGDYAWEDMAVCTEGHFFCRQCLLRSVQESIYGQGNILVDKSSICCISSSAQGLSGQPCTAFVALDVLRSALPDDMYNSLEDRSASESLERSELKLVRCPFCGYAEVDELQPHRIKRSAAAFCIALAAVGSIFFFYVAGKLWRAAALSFMIPLMIGQMILPSYLLFFFPWSEHMERAVRRVHLRRRGTLFKCASPRCSRESCIECSKEWAPFHNCYEKEEDSVRIYVEKAMANAVKRTCPRCHVSFIKSDGCNKLKCPCGYTMCYICRADIGEVGYKHFCQHFNPLPGTPCTECDSCNLYAQEDEAAAIRNAATEAEKEYWRNHGKPKGWKWKGVTGSRIGGLNAAFRHPGDLRDRICECLDQVLERSLDLAME